jgi:hypothetical protein
LLQMVPAEPCVFETIRSYRNDVRVEIAATIRNRLIVAIQPELRVALGRWRACGSFRWSTAGRWRSCLTGVYGGTATGGSQGPPVYRVVRASSASIHHLPKAPEEAPETIAHATPFFEEVFDHADFVGAERGGTMQYEPIPILRLRPAIRVVSGLCAQCYSCLMV